MAHARRTRLSLLMMTSVVALLAIATVACGTDRPASGPTATPANGTVTPTVGQPTPTSVPTSTPVPGSEIQARFNSARASWNASGPDSYSFDIAWFCFCGFSGDITRVVVEDGKVVSAIDVATGEPVGENERGPQVSINGLFDQIQRAFDNDDSEVHELSFERDLGYPISASIDWLVMAIDDEMSFQLTNFRPNSQVVDIEQLKADADAAMFRWFESGYESYEIVFRWQCFCPPEANSSVRIRVEAGQIVSVTDAETDEPVEAPGGLEYRDVRGLFDWISEQLQLNPEFAALEFDGATGYPVSASFNPIIQLIDEEQAFHISELTPLNVHDELQTELDEARSRWKAMSLTAYNYTFNWQCFCPEDFIAQVTVKVQDGEVISVARIEDVEPERPYRLEDFETVDGLFDRLQDAIDRGAASIRAEFDSSSGLPTEVFIDYQTIIADEELGWNASSVISAE